MTTIADLSKENLLLIFKQLDDRDFKQCQWVCRAWYPLAHCALLDDLYFESYSQIRRFIACIDLNPKPSYLAVVKNIFINALDNEAEDPEGNAVSPPILLGKENIFKLFFRFPNLKQIIINDAFKLLEEFDDEICAKFLSECPKLEYFDACTNSYEVQTRYAALLRKLRHLQTTINTDSLCDIPDLVGFLAELPRLNTITDDVGYFGTFEKWLLLLDQAPSITTLTIVLKEDDKLGFAEKYLAAKTRVQQHRFIQRLSTIESVYITCSPGTFVNSMKFIAKYLTGLTAISIQCPFTSSVNDMHQSLSIDIMTHLPVNKNYLDMKMSHSALTHNLPHIMNQVFHQPASTFNTPSRGLKLSLNGSDKKWIRLQSHKSLSRQHISITVPEIYQLAFFSLNSLPLDNVDKLELDIHDGPRFDDVQIYQNVIPAFSSLKKLHFRIPASFKNTRHYEVDKLCSLIEDATLQAHPHSTCQVLLDRWFYAFPDLKRLNLHHFSGIWKESIGEFQVELGKFTLGCLTVDVTPVKIKSLGKGQYEFFVVEVETLQSNERQLYKIPIDLSLANQIDDNDLNGLVRGEDYCKVHVTVKSLQKLELVLDKSRAITDKNFSCALNLTRVSRITLFNKGE